MTCRDADLVAATVLRTALAQERQLTTDLRNELDAARNTVARRTAGRPAGGELLPVRRTRVTIFETGTRPPEQ